MESSALWVVSAAALFLASFLALLVKVRSTTRLPAALAATVALALLISFDTLLLNLLSLIHGVTGFGVLAGHVLLLAALARRPDVFLRDVRRASRAISLRPPKLVALALAPLLGLILLSAVRYAPNDFDAMTCRLARVAHWIQNGSIGPYPTGIHRQLVSSPGSDYLLLVLQVVSRSDLLASLLTFCCFLLAALSGPSLARLAGAPARLAPLAALLVATLPLAVVQASSTHTDPLAAALAIAVVATCLPFLHARHGPRRPVEAGVLLGVTLAASALTRHTALLASAPFVVLALAAASARLGRGRGKSLLSPVPVLAAPAIALALVWPELWRRNLFTPTSDVLQELSSPPFFQLLFVAVALALLVRRIARVPPRVRYASAALVVSALLGFGAAPLSSGFQLPFFALCPLLLGAFGGPDPPRLAPGWQRAVATGLLALCLVYAGAVAVTNLPRPPLGRGGPRELSYYNSFDTDQAPHAATLDLAVGLPCRRLGLLLRESSYDYPLTWRAMKAGIEVRHVTGPDPWPCLVYSDRGAPPPVPGRIEWVPLAGSPPGGAGSRPFLFAPGAPLPRN